MKQELLLKKKKKVLSTEKKIEYLKRKLKQVHDRYVLQVFLILNEIYKLRMEQIPSYTLPDLAREKGIEQGIGSIRYLFGFLYMSKQTRKLLNEGKVTPTQVLQVITSSVEFRKHELQDKLMVKLVSGEIGVKQINTYNSYVLLKIANSESPMEQEKKIELEAIHQMNCMTRRIIENRKMLQSPALQEKMRNNFRQLSRVVNETLDNGFVRCPKCNHKFNVDDAYEHKSKEDKK